MAIKEITDRLDPKEFEFEMITLRFDRKLPQTGRLGNITIHRIGAAADAPRVSDRALPIRLRISKFFFPVIALRKALAIHRRNHFDLVWAMMANHAGFAALFFKYLHPRVPYFLELQDGRALVEMRERRRILIPIWWLYRRIFLKADRIKAISKYIASEVRALGYEREIEIIPNGVDVAKFSAPIANEKLQALKTKYGKKMGDVFLFTASRLVLSRGVEDIIRALPLLPQSVKLLIAGDGEDRSKLEKTSEECGVRNRTLFAGSINNSEIPAYFKISDIFVRPSIIEGFGSAFVEAFAAGIPIIATPVGGIPDFLFPPEKSAEPTGLFCRVRDPKSISEAIKQYMNDPSMTSRIIKNARKLATEKYDWNLIAADMHRKIFGKV